MTLKNLWIYQKERFPLAKTAPLLAVFSTAGISVSANLSGRPLPSIYAFIAGFLIAMLLFFQMRVCDEYKDFEDDLNYRPDRPIPRGLVSLKLIIALGVLSLPITAFVTWAWHPSVLWLLVFVWIWLVLMTGEFGVPSWLKARPILYLLSHMMIMPLIDLLLTGIEWVPHASAGAGLWLFIVLSFVNGCVLEIGRKLWSPENEIEGVDTYSKLWGHSKAATIWLSAVAVSFVLLLGVGVATQSFAINAILGAIGLFFCVKSALVYKKEPTDKAEKQMDLVAGLWVFACYAIAGIAPFIMRLF